MASDVLVGFCDSDLISELWNRRRQAIRINRRWWVAYVESRGALRVARWVMRDKPSMIRSDFFTQAVESLNRRRWFM